MNNLYSTEKQEKQPLKVRSLTHNDCYGTMEHESHRSAEPGFAPEDTEIEMAVYRRRLTRNGVHLPSIPSWQWPIRLFQRFILRQPTSHSNAISTTKYTILTFLPKNLFEQFHRYANIYFLVIVILSLIPAVEVFAKEVAPIPLLFVLSVTALKDIFEDYSRYRSDKTVNNRPCSVYKRKAGRFVHAQWKDVQLGDFVHLSCDEVIPADLLLLQSSDPAGVCYVQTSNLDGETSLKHCSIVPGGAVETDSDTADSLRNFSPDHFLGELHYQQPSSVINEFKGYIQHTDGSRIPVNRSHLLLRGCIIRNTDSIVGVVIYAGHQTKAMLNNSGPKAKRSRLERDINYDVGSLAVILILMCLTCAIVSGIWTGQKNETNAPFFPFNLNPALEGFIRFWSFLILFQVTVPISLYVSIEIVKVAQVFFINLDRDMYYAPSDTPIQCRALNITEDLGQIQYLMSDKTGTLTENDMVFRCCTINGKNYPHGLNDHFSEQTDAKNMYVSLESSSTSTSLNENETASSTQKLGVLDTDLLNDIFSSSDLTLHDFLVTMAICNTVVVSHRSSKSSRTSHFHQHWNESNLQYESESPDEYALVEAARAYGYVLQSRSSKSISLKIPSGEILEYEILNVLEFTPERKCMSVIVREKGGRERVMVYTKGADSTVMEKLANAEDSVVAVTQLQLNTYARLGLRTLCLARRELSAEEHGLWARQFHDAEHDLHQRDTLLNQLTEWTESKLELLGATGIEDRLQDRVSETIHSLHQAGLKVWVLTGDKMETAINIGYSSHLLDETMDVVVLQASSVEECEAVLESQLNELKRAQQTTNEDIMNTSDNSIENTAYPLMIKSCPDRCKRQQERTEGESGGIVLPKGLVVDGHTLSLALQPRLVSLFLNVAKRCHSVICCRATPLQKATVVKAVKEKLRVTTLAIGDGANDVSMIQQAHVGVGITGREGMQAAIASDFSMARFCFLKKLLLVHGHWCYSRLSRMVLYFFYKNLLYATLQFWYQLFNGFSGSSPIDGINLQVYNLVFSSIPILVVATLDQDVRSSTLLSNERLYGSGRKSKLYTRWRFWLTILEAVYQSATVFFISYAVYRSTDIGATQFGLTINTTAAVLINIHLAIETYHWTPFNHLVLWGSVVMVYLFNYVYTAIDSQQRIIDSYWIMMERSTDARFWFLTLVIIVIGLLPRLVMKVLIQMLAPSPLMAARAKEKDKCSKSCLCS